MIKCPSCGRSFSLTYSRTFACAGCGKATFGDCGLVKCPMCGEEFNAPGNRINYG